MYFCPTICSYVRRAQHVDAFTCYHGLWQQSGKRLPFEHSLVTMTFLYEKERDNTWLQLPVCPSVLRPPGTGGDRGGPCGAGDDADTVAACSFAHPPPHVLRHVLANGYVVSCHDFIFSRTSKRGGCTRTNCKYFHPPTHLRLLVINAGKNNMRLRSELVTSVRHQQQQQQAAMAAAAFSGVWWKPDQSMAAVTFSSPPSFQTVSPVSLLPATYQTNSHVPQQPGECQQS